MERGLVLCATVLLLVTAPWSLLAADLPKGDWVANGFDEESRDELREFLRGSYERKEVAGGSLLLMHGGEVIFEQAFGYADLRRRRAFTMATPCSVASISKPIVATLMVKMASEGKLDLDAPIDRYLPEYSGIRLRSGKPPRRMPKVRELLKHTAGFTPDGKQGGRPWFWKECAGKTLEEMVKLYPVFPIKGLYCNPGRGCWYSGMGYDVAGRIAEVAAGKPIHVLLKEELCAPLGMAETQFLPDPDLEARSAERYYQWRSDGSFHRKLRKRRPRAVSETSSSYTPIGGGIMSTPTDLATLLLLHRNRGMVGNERLIPERALLEMYERKRPFRRYGMGFVLGPETDPAGERPAWIMHTGSSGTMFWLDFEHDIIGVLLTQTQRSRGKAMPESQKRIPKDAPGFIRVLKGKVDAIFGWSAHPPRKRM